LKRLLFFFLFILFSLVGISQTISLSGFILALKGEKVKLIKNAQKNISFEGTLGDVNVSLNGTGYSSFMTTNLSGNFFFLLKTPGIYTLSVSRIGFSSLSMIIDYRDAGIKTRFESIYLILKEGEKSEIALGDLIIRDKGNLLFNSNPKGGADAVFQSNSHLMEKSCVINNASNYAKTVQPVQQFKATGIQLSPEDTIVQKSSLIKETKPLVSVPSFTEVPVELNEMTLQLNEAKSALASMDPASQEYSRLKSQVTRMEQQIKDKEQLINLQDKEISANKKIMTFMGLFIAALAFLALIVFYFFRQKKKFASELKEKNDRITKINSKLLSSIRYAALIQNGFFQSKNELKTLFKDSFIFNKPKDVLSGDFYWFVQKGDHKIIVVADCTGHGVPGAMLTVLGHNAVNEIVNVQGEVVPSRILSGLNRVIKNTFSKNPENLEYGMDITVVSIHKNEREMLVSGLSNGLYVQSKGQLIYHGVSALSFGSDAKDGDFVDKRIAFESEDCLFLFSDGFQDQFGKTDKGMEKFNITRFENLLQEIATTKDLSSAEQKLNSTMDKWKGDLDQIDDILIMGIRL